MKIRNRFNVFIGTANGLVGNTHCLIEQQPEFDFTRLEIPGEVTSLRWGRTEDEFVVGFTNGVVKLYDADRYELTKLIELLEGKGAVVGAEYVGDNVMIARQSGHISIWNEEKTYTLNLNLGNESTLDCAVFNKRRNNVVATGGERNDFKLWDVEKKMCIFQAKSMGHDELNLPIPTSIRGISFAASDEKLNACVTKEGHVLLYDERAQRRPVTKFLEPKASYTTMTTAHRERLFMVGTTKGYMQLIDLRVPSKCVKTFKTFRGSVTDIVCDPNSPLVASVSLDRILRFHNIDTRELLHEEYLKLSLTKLIVKPYIKHEPQDDEIPEAIAGDFDLLFESMEAVNEEIRNEDNPKPKAPKRKIKKRTEADNEAGGNEEKPKLKARKRKVKMVSVRRQKLIKRRKNT